MNRVFYVVNHEGMTHISIAEESSAENERRAYEEFLQKLNLQEDELGSPTWFQLNLLGYNSNRDTLLKTLGVSATEIEEMEAIVSEVAD